MRKLPKKVIVLGRSIPVKMVSKDTLNSYINGAEGIFDTYTMCIYINREAPIKTQKYYLLHEIVHVSHYLVGLDQGISPEVIEIICQTTATLFEDLAKQNICK